MRNAPGRDRVSQSSLFNYHFARFYFLSNEELLEILSQTKDPTMVQGHLKKCFEGIKRVLFDEDQVITDMFSSEGEQIKLADNIDPAGINVEDWMTMLDNMMKRSVKEVLWASMVEYMEIARTDWIQKVPGQCAINGSQFHWTREIEEGLDERGAEGKGPSGTWHHAPDQCGSQGS